MTKLVWKKTEHFHRLAGKVPHYTTKVGPAVLTCRKDPDLDGYCVSVDIRFTGTRMSGHVNKNVGCWKYLRDAKMEAVTAFGSMLDQLQECVIECTEVIG